MKLRRIASAVLYAAVTLPAAARLSRGSNRTDAAEAFFPVAVWYGGGKARGPMPERLDATSAERWGKDLKCDQSCGLRYGEDLGRLGDGRATRRSVLACEPDLLLRLAQERGLKVIIQIYLASAPDWVGGKYPDGRFVDRSGTVMQSLSAPGFCIDHTGVRREVTNFLEALSRGGEPLSGAIRVGRLEGLCFMPS